MSELYSLLQFDNALGIFTIVATVPKSALPAEAQALNPASIGTSFLVGETCAAGILFGSIYRLNNGQLSTILLGDGSTSIQAHTESMSYIASANKLYRYEALTESYSQIYTFGSSHTNFKIIDNSNRLTVLGWTSEVTPNPGLGDYRIVRQTVYVL